MSLRKEESFVLFGWQNKKIQPKYWLFIWGKKKKQSLSVQHCVNVSNQLISLNFARKMGASAVIFDFETYWNTHGSQKQPLYNSNELQSPKAETQLLDLNSVDIHYCTSLISSVHIDDDLRPVATHFQSGSCVVWHTATFSLFPFLKSNKLYHVNHSVTVSELWQIFPPSSGHDF